MSIPSTPNLAIIYVAGPYTDNDPRHNKKQRHAVQQKRYKAHLDYATTLTCRGLVVYSPILMCVPIARYADIAPDATIWMRFADAFVSRCTEIHVLQLPGWKQSRGLDYECRLAVKNDINIQFIPNATLCTV